MKVLRDHPSLAAYLQKKKQFKKKSNPGKYHEQIVRELILTIALFQKKPTNLCCVIYTGEHTDHIYSDLADPA